MITMNDNPKAILINNDVVQMLENALHDAKEGLIVSIGLVMISPTNEIGIGSAGNGGASIVAGLTHLQNKMLDMMFQPKRASAGLVIPGRLHQ